MGCQVRCFQYLQVIPDDRRRNRPSLQQDQTKHERTIDFKDIRNLHSQVRIQASAAGFDLVQPLAAPGFTLFVSDLACDIVLSKPTALTQYPQHKAKLRMKWAWFAGFCWHP
jgi:hypothetical protein